MLLCRDLLLSVVWEGSRDQQRTATTSIWRKPRGSAVQGCGPQSRSGATARGLRCVRAGRAAGREVAGLTGWPIVRLFRLVF